MSIQFLQVADDYVGLRKKFFNLSLRAIKERYFDGGLLTNEGEKYRLIGVLIGMCKSFKCRYLDNTLFLGQTDVH